MTLSPRSSSLLLFPLAVLVVLGSLFTNTAVSQTPSDGAGKRRVVDRRQPMYPQLARALNLEGVVRLEAVVSPDGTAKSVAIKGGHPVLADAAANAVRQWKWERASQESHELVEVKFARPD